MRQCQNLLQRVPTEGIREDDGTETGMLATFYDEKRLAPASGFPLVCCEGCCAISGGCE